MVIIGRGVTIGRPLAILLSLKRPGCNAAVTVVHTGVDPGRHGRARAHGRHRRGRRRPAPLLTPDMVKPGAAVVSAGTTFEGRKLIPDAHPDVAEVAGWITPAWAGSGPMTRAMLLRNALQAAEMRQWRGTVGAGGMASEGEQVT